MTVEIAVGRLRQVDRAAVGWLRVAGAALEAMADPVADLVRDREAEATERPARPGRCRCTRLRRARCSRAKPASKRPNEGVALGGDSWSKSRVSSASLASCIEGEVS